MKWLNKLLGIEGTGMPKYYNPPPPPKPILELELVRLLQETDWKVLIDWWDTLNNWGWPTELLPEEKPEETGGRRRSIMNFIDNMVGHKTILWYLNVIKEQQMTTEEFEDFWQYTRNHCKHAEKRYHARLGKRRETGA